MEHSPPKRARVLTVFNLKGGVGKTHISWLLASVCQEEARRVLIIDTDTQGNLSNSFAIGKRTPGVEQLLDPSQDADIRTLIRPTAFSAIDLIPAGGPVAPFDHSDQRDWERADLHRSFLDPVEAVRQDYEFIVFDCPPRLSLVSFAALVASDALIVPLEAADWGAQGIKQVAEAAEYVRMQFNPSVRLLGYVISRYRAGRTYQRTYQAELRRLFGEEVFDTVIPDLAGFERAVTDRIPVTQREPRSQAAALARQFFHEVVDRLAASESRSVCRVPADDERRIDVDADEPRASQSETDGAHASTGRVPH